MNDLSVPSAVNGKGLSDGHAGFVHLRVHSAYSLSESTLRLNKLAELAAADHQPPLQLQIALIYLVPLIFPKMMKAGIQPIIGAVVGLRIRMEQERLFPRAGGWLYQPE